MGEGLGTKAFFAANIGGALFACLVQFIEPAPFTALSSIMMCLMLVVGGPGYFFGAA